MRQNPRQTSGILRSIAFAVFVGIAVMPGTALAQEPFLGEIRWVEFNSAPRGWATCDGQLMSISQNTALFSLLGTIVRRQWSDDVRPARHARAGSSASRPGSGTQPSGLGRSWRYGSRHAHTL